MDELKVLIALAEVRESEFEKRKKAEQREKGKRRRGRNNFLAKYCCDEGTQNVPRSPKCPGDDRVIRGNRSSQEDFERE